MRFALAVNSITLPPSSPGIARAGRTRRVCGARSRPPPLPPRPHVPNLSQARQRASRPALADLDPNAPRQTRNGPQRPVTDGDENPRPRKRTRRTRAEIERDRNLPAAGAPPPPLPAGFRSRFQYLPAHDLGPLTIECEFCEARHWISETVVGTNQQFELCCKKGGRG